MRDRFQCEGQVVMLRLQEGCKHLSCSAKKCGTEIIFSESGKKEFGMDVASSACRGADGGGRIGVVVEVDGPSSSGAEIFIEIIYRGDL